jgi:IclR family acetate operon transcriptional repressor
VRDGRANASDAAGADLTASPLTDLAGPEMQGAEAVAESTTSLEKGLLVLRTLAGADRALTPAELAQATGLNRSTVHRLAEILCHRGWLTRIDPDDDRSRFELGPATLGIAALIAAKWDTEAKLRPIIDALARSLGETVHVGILEHNLLVHVDRAMPDTGMTVAASLGSREFAHATGLGKALLATLPDDELPRRFPNERLPQPSPRTIATRSRLARELEDIRARGYAIDDEESSRGVRCIAAPVFGPGSQPLFAISVTTMPQRLESDRLAQVAETVCAAAALATASFGGSTPRSWGTGCSPTASW